MNETSIAVARRKGHFREVTGSSLIMTGTGTTIVGSALVPRNVVCELLMVGIVCQQNSAVGGTGPVDVIRAESSATSEANRRPVGDRFGQLVRGMTSGVVLSGANATDAGAQTTIPIGGTTPVIHKRWIGPSFNTAVGWLHPFVDEWPRQFSWDKPGILHAEPGELLAVRHALPSGATQLLVNWAWREWSRAHFEAYYRGEHR